jgi:hypothetical protein
MSASGDGMMKDAKEAASNAADQADQAANVIGMIVVKMT